jgi:glycosidase
LLNFYREAIRLRKELPVVRHGSYREYFHRNRWQYVYTREMPGQQLLVVCSYRDRPQKMKTPKDFPLEKSRKILGSHPGKGELLRPYECRVYLLED